MTADLSVALSDLSEAESRLVQRLLLGMAHSAADDGKRRLAGAWHALAVTVAESLDDQRRILSALRRDLEDDDGEAGEIVGVSE